MSIDRRANNVASTGIMPKQDWYTVELLANKYGTKQGHQPVTDEDFAKLMVIVKKGAEDPGKDNIKNAAHLGAVSGLLATANMNAEQKQVIADAMKEMFRQPDTEPSKNQIKFFAMFVMKGIKNDGLVQDAVPYVNDKDAMTRTMARQYLETLGYKI